MPTESKTLWYCKVCQRELTDKEVALASHVPFDVKPPVVHQVERRYPVNEPRHDA